MMSYPQLTTADISSMFHPSIDGKTFSQLQKEIDDLKERLKRDEAIIDALLKIIQGK